MAELYDIEAIRAQHPIAHAVSGAGVELRRSGRRLVGLCPFHEDRTPSLVVYEESGSYFCFGCDAGGDVFDFIGRLHGTAFRETAALLAGSAGGGRPPPAAAPPPLRRSIRAVAADEAAVIEAAASLYAGQYGRSREARSYLRGRGIDDGVAAGLRVGFAGGGLARHLERSRLGLDTARGLGLLIGDRDTLSGRIVVPDLDARGLATWLTARSLDGREPRYLNLRLPSPLLGLEQVRRAEASAVVVTEGPFDWLTLCAWRLPGVALLGTHVSREALAALRSLGRVYLALDADDPGGLATARLASALKTKAIVVPLPAGAHDLSELGRRPDGRVAFLRSLHEAREGEKESWLKSDAGRRARAA